METRPWLAWRVCHPPRPDHLERPPPARNSDGCGAWSSGCRVLTLLPLLAQSGLPLLAGVLPPSLSTRIVVATRHLSGRWRCPTPLGGPPCDEPLQPSLAARSQTRASLRQGDSWSGGRGVVRGDPRKDCLAINLSAVTSQTLLASWQVSCRWRQSQPTPPARVHLGVLRVGERSGRLVARSPAGHSHPLPRAHRGCAAEAPAFRYHRQRRLRPRRWLCISCSQPAPPRPSLILSVVPAGHNVGPCHSCLLAALPTGDPVERTARPALCGPFTPVRWPLLRDCSHWSLWDRYAWGLEG